MFTTACLTRTGFLIKAFSARDELHMNPKGYAIWQKIIQPYLRKK